LEAVESTSSYSCTNGVNIIGSPNGETAMARHGAADKVW
jgi:hypothetical protein